MKLTRAGPGVPTFNPEFTRFIDRVFGPLEVPERATFETAWVPSVDLSETDTEFVARLEAPGVHKENMDVNLEGNVLTLSGHREFGKDEEKEGFIYREREEGKFVRSMRLPKPVEGAKVAATYQDGILTVRLPKAQPTVKSKITVK